MIRPWSVDSLDGGATDVPILGPMELKNDTFVLSFSKFYFIFLFSTDRLYEKGP